jgi:lipoprotein-anchoring transpeptidase ErfK/SrfK
VLVNLAQQHLWAFDGTNLVQELDVSTGVAGHATPTGSYQVMQRFLSQEMIGPGYDLPNVPYVQYFGNDSLSWQEGYSLHGTYWHHNWGHVMSHGCVNLPTDFAAWLWDWANVGTPVEIIAG